MNNQLNTKKTGALALALLLASGLMPSTLLAQGTAFTYQGHLIDGGNPANGNYDLTFALFDTSNGVTQVSVTLTNLGTGVTNGLFNTTLDFGPGIFAGADRWLEIGVRTNGAGSFLTVAPRQQLTPAPYAIFANLASNITGVIANGSLPASPGFSGTVTGGAFSGSGANLTSINAGNVTTGTLADGELSPNVALLNRNGQNFTGTQAFTGGLRVNSSVGFDQSSLGGFFIDAPFIVGGRVTVLNSGNVGIGTNNPSQKLHVAGNMLVSGAFNLPASPIINSGVNRILFSDANQNFFAGQGAGIKGTNSSNNSGFGYEALFADTTGSFNTALGGLAMGANTTGNFNTATGFFALGSNTNGVHNTGYGFEVLALAASGVQNTAVGSESLFVDTTGNNNTAVGFGALFENTVGNDTAVGISALNNNTTGTGNVAVGDSALATNTTASGNVAVGQLALRNSTGGNNVAIGQGALNQDTTGANNVAVGPALSSTITGSGNIGIGIGAGRQLGPNSGNNIDIGDDGSFTDQSTIRIGGVIHHDVFLAGVHGRTAAGGAGVFVDSNGHLGTLTSSAKFKQNIRSMDDQSDVLLALRPVSFQYKPEYDPKGIPQFGLIAEEVEKVDPDLVAHDANNNIYTVRYQAVDAMLVNECLKQQDRIVAQEEGIRAMQERNESLKERLDRLEQMMKSGGANN